MGLRIHYTLETAPTGQFLEVPEHPGVTFYKVAHAACPGLKPATKRSWTLACIHHVEEAGSNVLHVVLTPCQPGVIELSKVEAIITHPQAFLSVRRHMQLSLRTGNVFHPVERKEHAHAAPVKPGLKRLMNGSMPTFDHLHP